MSVHAFLTEDDMVCDECGTIIEPGTIAYYDTEEPKHYCPDCVEGD